MHWFYLGTDVTRYGEDQNFGPEILSISTVSNIPEYTYLEHIPHICGKSGAYIITDGSKYYNTVTKGNNINRETINLTCQKRGSKYGCPFKVTLKMQNIFDRNLPGFYDRSNLSVKQSVKKYSHTCDGYFSLSEARIGPQNINLRR